MIKDSGNRREFETGAVRDMQDGKGRCDLLPLDCVIDILGVNDILKLILEFQEKGDHKILITAIKCFYTLNYSDSCSFILDLSKHFEEGAKKYEENNWKKGIHAKVYIDSALRHYFKWLRGDNDENHDRAFLWNLICCYWTCKHIPELNDYKWE